MVNVNSFHVCKLCIIRKGLRGADLAAGTCPYAFKTEDALIEHFRTEHNLIVKAEVKDGDDV